MLPKMSACRINFEENKCVPLLTKNLEKYNEIWDKASNTFKKVFDSKPVYNRYIYKKLKQNLKTEN